MAHVTSEVSFAYFHSVHKNSKLSYIILFIGMQKIFFAHGEWLSIDLNAFEAWVERLRYFDQTLDSRKSAFTRWRLFFLQFLNRV